MMKFPKSLMQIKLKKTIQNQIITMKKKVQTFEEAQEVTSDEGHTVTQGTYDQEKAKNADDEVLKIVDQDDEDGVDNGVEINYNDEEEGAENTAGGEKSIV